MSDLDAQVIVDTATRAANPKPLADGFKNGEIALYSTVVPAGSQLHIVNTESVLAPYRDRPRRKNGIVNLTEAASLVGDLAEVGREQGTVLYANWRTHRVVAVINDHDTEGAGWGDHRAVLTLTLTPEWEDWKRRDGVLSGQVEFAEHIEDHTGQIVDPPAADLLELAQTFYATSSVSFKSRQLLASGETQFRYEEDVSARAGVSGQLSIPASFLLRMAIFEGMEPVEIGARFRYRLRDGHLAVGYKLDSPDTAVRAAVDAVIADIEASLDCTVLRGTPRS